MNPSAISYLRCPICGADGECSDNQKSFYCNGSKRHCYDFSKSGYLNLAGPQGGAGDLKEAVRARSLFLDAGYYEPLSNAIVELLNDFDVKSVLDAGCGEGYYTNRMANNQRTALGIDLSIAGIDHAAKHAKRERLNASFAVASLFHMPVANDSFEVITSIFAPCAETEFKRVLKNDGYLIIVGAGKEHLFGLKRVLYDDPYKNDGRSDLPREMIPVLTKKLTYEITVEGKDQIHALFSMTPYYWRTSDKDREKLSALDRLTTEVDFDIFVYRKG